MVSMGTGPAMNFMYVFQLNIMKLLTADGQGLLHSQSKPSFNVHILESKKENIHLILLLL